MEVSYTAKNGLSAKFEGEVKDVFEEIGVFQEVFAYDTCGKCQGKDLKFQTRENEDKDKFYELVCRTKDSKGFSCNAKLSFGCHKKGGGLFPQRKDKDGKYKNNDGWTKWNKETGKEE